MTNKATAEKILNKEMLLMIKLTIQTGFHLYRSIYKSHDRLPVLLLLVEEAKLH